MPMADSKIIQRAIEAFDRVNETDPNQLSGEPKELVLARYLTEFVYLLDPDPSDALLLASRCQHICRWQVPRSSEPAGRAGYLKWRAGLKHFHAQKSAEILGALSVDDELIERVKELNLKNNLKSDPECQTIEDALCLVFLKYQFDALLAQCDEEKMVKIVQKTWRKMSAKGHELALDLSYSEPATKILATALEE